MEEVGSQVIAQKNNGGEFIMNSFDSLSYLLQLFEEFSQKTFSDSMMLRVHRRKLRSISPRLPYPLGILLLLP